MYRIVALLALLPAVAQALPPLESVVDPSVLVGQVKPPPKAVAAAEPRGPVLPVVGPQTIAVGAKLILRADESIQHASWDIPLPSDQYERFGSAVAIWTSRPQTIRVVLTAALVDDAGKFEGFKQYVHVVTVTGDGPKPEPPKDPPHPPPGDLDGLADYMQQSVEQLVTGTERRGEAQRFAGTYLLTAVGISTGQLTTVKAVQDAQKAAVKTVRAGLDADREALWQRFFGPGGPYAGKLEALGRAGKLSTVEQVRDAWLQIAAGLGAVR